MKTVEELLQENGGQVIKAVRTYRNTKEWNQFAEDFKELYDSAKRVSEGEAKKVRDMIWEYFNGVLSEFNEDSIENEDELKAFLRLKDTMESLK
jgi:hypothetical protein